MRADGPTRVAYVVKRYPRFSETFVVNEILAHEAVGLDVEIFSLYPPNDTHFQDAISRVRAPVTYLTAESLRGVDLWSAIECAGNDVPFLWRSLDLARGAEARVVYQGAWLAREIRRRGITHVHAHFATASAEVARLAAGWAHVPFTVTAHAKDIFHESVAPERLRRVLSAANRVVTVSDFNVEYLTRVVGLDDSLVTRIYNGLDLERFAPITVDIARVPRIVSVGRFVVKKGLDDLLRACALLRDRGRLFECVLVGSGVQEGYLRSLVSALELDGQVRLSGPLPQDQVIDVVRTSMVFAAPCVVAEDGDRDGLPTVLLESMALGTPVVSTDVVGIPEIVRHDDTGLLVPQRDPHQLADALDRCMSSPALQRHLARNARGLVEREFDGQVNAGRLRSLFNPATDAAVAMAS